MGWRLPQGKFRELNTYNESDWYLPGGARIKFKRRELKTYEDDEPVYATKYYYEIDRWDHERNIKESGNDKNPYYGKVVIGENEREARRYITYSISCVTDKGKSKIFSVDEMDFKELRSGDHVQVKAILGHVKSLTYLK